MGEKMRIDKFLVHMGLATRSEAKKAARARRICLDGEVVRDSGAYVYPGDVLTFDGIEVPYVAQVYVMLNKPAGYLSATEDRQDTVVTMLLPEALRRRGVFPVGRLDKDTTGLLLLTDDGALAHRLRHPKNHVGKSYLVTLDQPMRASWSESLAAGVVLADGYKCLPAQLTLCEDMITQGIVTIYEGKFHQVKRMFAALGAEVIALKRLSMGSLTLDEHLAPGAYRHLRADEVARLYADGAGPDVENQMEDET